MRVRKAVIPAAGLGTRFLPVTKAQPKEMLPIIDTPIIQYVIQEAIDAGIEDIIVVTGRHKRSIEDHFDRSFELEMQLDRHHKSDLLDLVQSVSRMVDVHFIRQKEPLGLGHAVLCAQMHVGSEPFAVLLGDEIYSGTPSCLKQLLDVHEETGATVIAARQVPDSQVSRYGIINSVGIGRGLHEVKGLIEKPNPESAPSNLAIMGRYIIAPEIFPFLKVQAPGANGEIQLTDALEKLSRQSAVLGYEFSGRRRDVGEKLGYLEAIVEEALARPGIRDEFLEYLRNVVDGSPEVDRVAAGSRGGWS